MQPADSPEAAHSTELTASKCEAQDLEPRPSLASDERGLETVEWAILLGLIVATVITVVIALGSGARDTYEGTYQLLVQDPNADYKGWSAPKGQGKPGDIPGNKPGGGG